MFTFNYFGLSAVTPLSYILFWKTTKRTTGINFNRKWCQNIHEIVLVILPCERWNEFKALSTHAATSSIVLIGSICSKRTFKRVFIGYESYSRRKIDEVFWSAETYERINSWKFWAYRSGWSLRMDDERWTPQTSMNWRMMLTFFSQELGETWRSKASLINLSKLELFEYLRSSLFLHFSSLTLHINRWTMWVRRCIYD